MAHGEGVIIKVRDERPADYMKVVASLLPKEHTGEDGGPIVAEIRRTIIRPSG